MAPVDDIGISATLARIREITSGASAAPAATTAGTAATSGDTTLFAQSLAEAQADGTGDPATGLTAGTAAATPGLPGAGGTGASALSLPATAAGTTGTPVYTTVNGAPVMITPPAAATPTPPQATAGTATAPAAGGAPGSAGTAGPLGQRLAAIARAEVGVQEQPPGSNDGPRIAEYRRATRGSGVGPWCAYFVSWVGAQAGVPVGAEGRGEGWVPGVERWARQSGRWIPAGDPTTPQAGDLIVFDRNRDGLTDHMGMVTGVRPDGGVETVEGNSSDAVSQRSYGRGEWTGLVRMVAPGV